MLSGRRWEKRERAAYGLPNGQEATLFVLLGHDCNTIWQEHTYPIIQGALVGSGLTELSALQWQSNPSGLSVRWECRVAATGPEAETRFIESLWPDLGEAFLWSTPDGSTKVLLDRVEGETGPWVLLYVWGDHAAKAPEALDSAMRQAEEEHPA